MLADRLALSAEVRSRLVDAIETGYREAWRDHFAGRFRAEDEAAAVAAVFCGVRVRELSPSVS